MRTRIVAIIVLAAAVLATAASATTFLYIPGPEDDARSKAAGRAAINTSGAPRLFENLSEYLVVRVRHRASGLECSFDDDDESRIQLLPNARRVEEIRCSSTSDGAGNRTQAVRIDGPVDVEAAALASVEAFRNTFNAATPAIRAPCPSSPPHEPLSAICYVFAGEKNGDKLRAWSGTIRTRNWIVTQQHDAWDGYAPENIASVGDMYLRIAIAAMPRSSRTKSPD